jgi:hypothetical protein
LSPVKTGYGMADGVIEPESNIGNLGMGRDYRHSRGQRAWHVEISIYEDVGDHPKPEGMLNLYKKNNSSKVLNMVQISLILSQEMRLLDA